MMSFLVRRLIGVFLTMFVVASIVFLVMDVVPGDPAALILGKEATAEQVMELRAQLGLDEPVHVRLLTWYGGLLRADLGRSLFDRDKVLYHILGSAEVTLLLTFMATCVGVLLGVSLGILAALRPGSSLDWGCMAFALFGVSMPSFWLGLNMILLFALVLHWFPSAGYSPLAQGLPETVRHLLLPAIALGFSQSAVIARMTRSTLVEVLREDYVRTARAKGLQERLVIAKHGLRNAMVPILGVIGILVALLLGGAIIVEKVFTLPGMGSLVVNSILRRDLPVIQGVLMVIAFIVAAVNLLVDIMYAVLDPRIRLN